MQCGLAATLVSLFPHCYLHFISSPLQQTIGWCAVDTYEMLRKRILATIKAKLEAPGLPEVIKTSEPL